VYYCEWQHDFQSLVGVRENQNAAIKGYLQGSIQKWRMKISGGKSRYHTSS
jgi:hypothetical protein